MWHRLSRHLLETFLVSLNRNRRTYDEDRIDESQDRFRANAYRYTLLILSVVLAPVNAYNYFNGLFIPAVAGISLLAIFLTNIWQLSRDRKPFLSPITVLILTMILVLLSILYGQNYSLYWLYPLLVALPILLRTRWSVWLAVLCGLVVSPLLFQQYDSETAVVIIISMAHTWFISAALMYAVVQQSSHLKGIANTDQLTCAFNRRYYEIEVERAFELWETHQRPTSLLLMDIDHFKKINDKMGHTVGDRALKLLVKIISDRIRGADTLCRYGGEEFVILLNETSIQNAVVIAEELRTRIASANILPEASMTISIGVCDITLVENSQAWFDMADQALYSAKDKGRNKVELALCHQST